MFSRAGVGTAGLLFTHERLIRPNVEHNFRCIYRVDCVDCCSGIHLDYEPPQSQHAAGSLIHRLFVMTIKKTPLVISILSIAIIGLVTLFTLTSKTDFGEKTPRSFAELGGNFTLQSSSGDVSLSDFKGKAVVMYFGFMSCPEVCPNSMGIIQAAFGKMSSEELSDIQGIMISIDPQRDNLKSLEKFTQYYHPNIIGITGDDNTIEQTADQYGAYFKRTEDKTNDYLFEHVSRYYVIDRDGHLVDALRHSTTPNELAAKLRETLTGKALALQ